MSVVIQDGKTSLTFLSSKQELNTELKPFLNELKKLKGITLSIPDDLHQLSFFQGDLQPIFQRIPSILHAPQSIKDLCHVISLCYQHKIPFTTRGSALSYSGQAYTPQNGLLILMTHLNKIEKVDSHTIKAQAGALVKDLKTFAGKHNELFPVFHSIEQNKTIEELFACSPNFFGQKKIFFENMVRSITFINQKGDLITQKPNSPLPLGTTIAYIEFINFQPILTEQTIKLNENTLSPQCIIDLRTFSSVQSCILYESPQQSKEIYLNLAGHKDFNQLVMNYLNDRDLIINRVDEWIGRPLPSPSTISYLWAKVELNLIEKPLPHNLLSLFEELNIEYETCYDCINHTLCCHLFHKNSPLITLSQWKRVAHTWLEYLDTIQGYFIPFEGLGCLWSDLLP